MFAVFDEKLEFVQGLAGYFYGVLVVVEDAAKAFYAAQLFKKFRGQLVYAEKYVAREKGDIEPAAASVVEAAFENVKVALRKCGRGGLFE